MNKRDEYLARAVECQSMASLTRDETERGTWLEMAVSWLRVAEVLNNRHGLVRALTEGPFARRRSPSCRLRKRIHGLRRPIATAPPMPVSFDHDRE
jgi:hypothetical protein